MNDRPTDPLDDILKQAFRREYSTLADADLVAHVVRRIALQSRIRTLVLGLAMLFGAMICASYVLPVLANLSIWLEPLVRLSSETLPGAIPIVLGILGASWLFTLVDDPI